MGLFDGQPLTREEMIEVERQYAAQQRSKKLSRGGVRMTDLKPEKKAMIESKTITVAYQVKGRRADRVVTADIIGPLAVHPTVNEDGAWTVTHVVTGHAVYRFFSSNLEAVAIAKELAAHRGWIGSVEEIMANGELKRAVTQALRAIGVMVK